MIPQEAYKAIEQVVGSKYISQEPEICRAYTLKDRGFYTAEARVLGRDPACVVLPGTAEEVQQIVKIANRYKIGYTPSSTLWFPQAGPRFDDCLFLDLKRFKSLEIDPKNMNATCGTGVIFAQLQAEALKYGLYTMVPGGGSQVGVVPNHLIWSFSPLTYRTGMANRRIMGCEWILPSGEIVRLGSLASGDDPYWGEGIGPDLRGILRGSIGWFGSLGIVTKMCVKLFPFHHEPLPKTGITPNTFLKFPEHRMKWYNFTCPSKEELIEMMYDMGHAEIAAAATRVPVAWRYIAKAGSKEDFWEKWKQSKGKHEEVTESHVLRILLIGYTSAKQLEYEEKVLMAIAEKHGATHRRTFQGDQSWMQSADSVSMWWLTGAFMSVTGQVDTIDCGIKTGVEFSKLKAKFTPPTMPDYGDEGWFQTNDFGHSGYLEFLNYWDPNDTEKQLHKVDEYYQIAGPKLLIKSGALSFFIQTDSPLSLDGPNYGPNYDKFARKVKDALDPQHNCNPPGILDVVDEVVEKAPWLKKKKNWA